MSHGRPLSGTRASAPSRTFALPVVASVEA